jgi:hypothetical protein
VLSCIGDNTDGAVSNAGLVPRQFELGGSNGCMTGAAGSASCWGLNNYGQGTPPALPAGLVWREVNAGLVHSCGVASDGSGRCWGFNGDGQTVVPSGTWQTIGAGMRHSCGLRGNGTLACWGRDLEQQVSTTPGGVFKALAVGGYHNCAIREDGTLACWGQNEVGQGNPPAGTFVSVSSGTFHSCAIRSDGTRTCWGDDANGQAPRFDIGPATLADANTTGAYSRQLTLLAPATYTLGAHAFGVVAGALPAGMSLSASGLLAGTPAAAGSYSFTVQAEDANGFTATRAYTLRVVSDTTPPAIAPAINGTLGNNGWYTGDVAVSWNVSDADSAIATSAGCNATSVTTDTIGATFTCTASSAGGTATQSVTIKRDATAPVLLPVPATVLLHGSATVVDASDATSGIATSGCSALDTSSVGAKTTTCTATDAAGNSAGVEAAYRVVYGFAGFEAPLAEALNAVQSKKYLPFKWRVFDADNADVTGLSVFNVTRTTVSCPVDATPVPVSAYGTSNTTLQYLGGGRYQRNWLMPVWLSGSCVRLRIDLGDGMPHDVVVKLQ